MLNSSIKIIPAWYDHHGIEEKMNYVLGLSKMEIKEIITHNILIQNFGDIKRIYKMSFSKPTDNEILYIYLVF